MRITPVFALTAFITTATIVFGEEEKPIEPPLLTSPVGPPPEEDEIPLSKGPGVIRPVYKAPKSGSPISESRILSLYHQLKFGQSREEIEKLVGKPVIGTDDVDGSTQWYINECETREIKGSPWGLAGIRVNYDKDDRLVSARYNFQYVRTTDIEKYHIKYGDVEFKADGETEEAKKE